MGGYSAPATHLVVALHAVDAACGAEHDAEQWSTAAALSLLVNECGIDVNAVDEIGRSALGVAALLSVADAAEAIFDVADAADAAMAAALAAGAAAAAEGAEGGDGDGAAAPAAAEPAAKATGVHVHVDVTQGEAGTARNALHWAAVGGSAEVASVICKRAQPDELAVAIMAVDSDGNTPLHCCAYANDEEDALRVAAVLLGVDKAPADVENLRGKTPTQLADQCGLPALARKLRGEPVGDVGVADRPLPGALLITHDDCMKHYTAADMRRGAAEPPPENERRLDVLLNPAHGTLRAPDLGALLTEEPAPRVAMAHVLRVHEYAYIRRVLNICGEAQPDADDEGDEAAEAGDDEGDAGAAAAAAGGGGGDGAGDAPANGAGNGQTNNKAAGDGDGAGEGVGEGDAPQAPGGADAALRDVRLLDSDTAVSRGSWEAALRASGAVIRAVDAVCAPDTEHGPRRAFCAVRPPGHHAGPTGIVTCERDREGSHGFCLLNNVAIGAAYARATYGGAGVKRVAIFDFDVHHGNGTEAAVRNLRPHTTTTEVPLPMGSLSFNTASYKPWLDSSDGENVMFISVHGFGKKEPGTEDDPREPWFYPASGSLSDNEESDDDDDDAEADGAKLLFERGVSRPNVLNVPITFQMGRDGWYRAMRETALPTLAAFAPDIIFISAGFDAHEKDEMNFGYVGMAEHDYDWLTRQLVKVANASGARIVSVLEGGYAVHGVTVSAFARAVAAHVRALCNGSAEAWDDEVEALALEADEERAEEAQLAAAAEEQQFLAEAAALAAEPDADAGGRRRSKRRRTDNVDYAALDAAMRAEEAAAASRATEGGAGAAE